ncbi:2-oxoglutarate dehydrogenase, mitochondrial [Plasmodiophora brassicae]
MMRAMRHGRRPLAMCRARRLQSSGEIWRGANAAYMDAMFERWRSDPKSVHASWDAYFRSGQFTTPPAAGSGAQVSSSLGTDPSVSTLSNKVTQLIRAYQVRGHYAADLDPLGITRHGIDRQFIAEDEFSLSKFGLSEADLDRTVNIGLPGTKGFQDPSRSPITLRALIEQLKQTYTRHIGVEYMHIPDRDQCNWIRDQIETAEPFSFAKEGCGRILDRLTWADHFERFLAQKWSTAKRFGLEGAEAVIPGMKQLIDHAASIGVKEVVLGMPHRGRLNVLANVVRKPLQDIFTEFSGGGDTSEFEGSGDVKYHLGMSFNRPVYGGGNVHLSLLANPSHLEAVNPVVLGKSRAKQFYKYDLDHSRVLPLLLHGDAAFSGQGVVYETMGLNDLPSYTVGGTVHIIVNNQIGFTTDPFKSRSSAYCSDIAKAFNAPVFHVNGNDPESVVRVHHLAAAWRQQFGADVVIDLVCYRKFGHNEIDEPMFTQPLMYRKIAKMPSVLDLYRKKLADENIISADEANEISNKATALIESAFGDSREKRVVSTDWLSTNWEGLKAPSQHSLRKMTGVDQGTLLSIGEKLCTTPEGFNVHRRLANILKNKESMFESQASFDWGTAEALAFGSLLLEKIHVRLSGQDVERGTFSHRHAVLHDQVLGNTDPYVPLSQLSSDQAKFTVSNSNLSEFGVLGFELGYSLENPHALILWEAQFGDFANGAQVIFDQFISCGEAKWLRQSGIVVLLPHGYEGQGPEHSSARLERFLQMCSEDEDTIPLMAENVSTQVQKSNWQVVMPSTPANYFHVLRRQVHRQFRKPLIVMNPKSLLRHKLAVSTLQDMAGESRFLRVIPESRPEIVNNASDVKKLVFCSGKVYYDLLEHAGDKHNDVALCRVEQLSPFPFDRVAEEAERYPNAEIVWAQEEPKNMGAYTYVKSRLLTALSSSRDLHNIQYVGRPPSASPATGFASVHKKEFEDIMHGVFG